MHASLHPQASADEWLTADVLSSWILENKVLELVFKWVVCLLLLLLLLFIIIIIIIIIICVMKMT